MIATMTNKPVRVDYYSVGIETKMEEEPYKVRANGLVRIELNIRL